MQSDIDITQASIIATMLLFPEAAQEVSENTQGSWFTGDYRKALDYLASNDGSDPAALSAATSIPVATIMRWMEQEFSSQFLKKHIANLAAEASMRKVRILGQQILKVGSVEEAAGLIDRFAASMDVKDKTEPVGMKQGVSGLMSELERRYLSRGNLLGMSYGIDALDSATEGLHLGDLVVVAGPSSMGKTAFALGVTEAVAAAGNKALAFSFEMTREQLLMRSLAAQSSVPLGRIRAANFHEADWARMTEAMGIMRNWPLEVDDPAGITITELVRKLKKAKRQGLKFALIDYLQIMSYDKSRENMEIDIITTKLKNTAKELQICIMMLSQLTRGTEKDKRKPNMSDLRGSGMIENNADVILFPWRDAANCEKCREKIEDATHSTAIHQAEAEIIIGKQRQGERNISIPATWIGQKTRFVSRESRHV